MYVLVSLRPCGQSDYWRTVYSFTQLGEPFLLWLIRLWLCLCTVHFLAHPIFTFWWRVTRTHSVSQLPPRSIPLGEVIPVRATWSTPPDSLEDGCCRACPQWHIHIRQWSLRLKELTSALKELSARGASSLPSLLEAVIIPLQPMFCELVRHPLKREPGLAGHYPWSNKNHRVLCSGSV